MEYFDDALPDLQDSLPEAWHGARDPNGELYKMLDALADLVDELSATLECTYLNTSIATANLEALLFEYAYVYGILNEEAPLGEAALRAYIKARAAEDLSVDSLRRTLLALLQVEPNLTGTVLTFPGDGSGLTFPASGSGLALFQTSAGGGPLTFPVDGSGLTFPGIGGVAFAEDGSGLALPFDFPVVVDVTFPADPVGWVLIEEFPTFFRVTTKSWLAFNRPAFLRAMTRHRPSHTLPPVLVEVSS